MVELDREFVITPDFVSRAKDLSRTDKAVYSKILTHSRTFGYTSITDRQLCESLGISSGSVTEIKRSLLKLKRLEYIKTEGGTRSRKIFPIKRSKFTELKENIRTQTVSQSKVFKENIRTQTVSSIRTQIVSQSPTPPIYSKEERRRIDIEAPPSSDPSVPKNENSGQEKSARKLPRLLKGNFPRPGTPDMVRETLALLSYPLYFGSQEVRMHDEDKKYFLGFSPSVVAEALEKTHVESKRGVRISNFCAFALERCGEIIRERG